MKADSHPGTPWGGLVREMRRSRFPKDRKLAIRVGYEYVRAAIGCRDPEPWAREALTPRFGRQSTKRR